MAATADMDAFAAIFEDEFSPLACISTSMVTSTWYNASGASCHMTGVREYFNNLGSTMPTSTLYLETIPSTG